MSSIRYFFRENIAVVHLYFVESQFTAYVKNELYGFTELLCKLTDFLTVDISHLHTVSQMYFNCVYIQIVEQR